MVAGGHEVTVVPALSVDFCHVEGGRPWEIHVSTHSRGDSYE